MRTWLVLTIQVFWPGQVDDPVDHLSGIVSKLPQVLAQGLIMQPLLLNDKQSDGLSEPADMMQLLQSIYIRSAFL